MHLPVHAVLFGFAVDLATGLPNGRGAALDVAAVILVRSVALDLAVALEAGGLLGADTPAAFAAQDVVDAALLDFVCPVFAKRMHGGLLLAPQEAISLRLGLGDGSAHHVNPRQIEPCDPRRIAR